MRCGAFDEGTSQPDLRGRSGLPGRRYLARDLAAVRAFCHAQIMDRLQVQPGLGISPEIAGQSHRCVGCDAATLQDC